MAILQVDLLLKTGLEAALADLRRCEWLWDDVWGGLESDCFALDAIAKVDYGFHEVSAAKQWFRNNNIFVYLPFRTDSPEFPAISITSGPNSEMINRTSLADDGSVEDFDIHSFTSIPQKIYNPFAPKAYDLATGTVTFPDNIHTDIMAAGQFLVSAVSGKAYVIRKVTGAQTFQISPNIVDDFKGAYVAPQIALWNLHREQTWFQHTFYLGCHAQSDPVQTMWLHALVEYILLRYKEVYLEARGFEVSTFSSDQMILNPHFNPEMVFTQTITLTGQVEASWAKFIAPRFYKVRGQVVIKDGPHTPPTYLPEAQGEGIVMEADSDIPTALNNHQVTTYGAQHQVETQIDAFDDVEEPILPDIVDESVMHSIGDNNDDD